MEQQIYPMATTFDNKYLFVFAMNGGFRDFDISTRNRVNKFGVENMW